MQREGFRVTAAFEEQHWWFRARRDLFLCQVEKALREGGERGRRPRLLDYGCGTGFNLRFLARYGEAFGADVGHAYGEEFRSVPEGAWVALDGDLSPHKGRFDVVTALDVLEHLDDDVAGLVAMRELLGPGGQLVLTVPAYRWLWSGEDAISDHRRRYTRPALERACRAAGFELRFVSYFNLAILPAVAATIWAERLLHPNAPPRSNLRPLAPRVNEWLYRLVAREARWVGQERVRLPAGASLVARCAA
jgi:SAM-dependent methyltransferase